MKKNILKTFAAIAAIITLTANLTFAQNQYINVLAGKNLVISTNDTARMTITTGGLIGIGTVNPTEKLEINGNFKVSGVANIGSLNVTHSITSDTITATLGIFDSISVAHFPKMSSTTIDTLIAKEITVSRIRSNDSLIYIGDSTIIYNTNNNNIFTNNKGIGIGFNAQGDGLRTVSLGNFSKAKGGYSITLGTRVYTGTNSDNSIVIGSNPAGIVLENDIPYSLMVGFNSTKPTLFVSSANGGVTTGNVGIATTNPISKFQVGSGITKVSFGDCYGQPISWGTSYIGFNLSRTSAGTWTTETDGSANGGCAIYGNVGGAIFFTKVAGTTSHADQTGITDAQILSNVSMTITSDGNVGIGTTDPGTYKLAVDGAVAARRFKVTLGNFYDYVFEKDYQLMSLDSVEAFVVQNKHLPDIPSQKEVLANGLDIGEFNALLLKKIEELTLYIITLKKDNEQLNQRIETLEKK